jgi:hypothetical protein
VRSRLAAGCGNWQRLAFETTNRHRAITGLSPTKANVLHINVLKYLFLSHLYVDNLDGKDETSTVLVSLNSE